MQGIRTALRGALAAATLLACAAPPLLAEAPDKAPVAKRPPDPAAAASNKAIYLKLTPALLRSGQTVHGQITRSDPQLDDESHYDLYRVHATRGQTLRITMRSPAFDTYLILGDGDGTLFAENDDHDGTDSFIEHTVDATGDYLIAANALSADLFGRYTLTVTVDGSSQPAPSSGEVGTIAPGQPVAGRLDGAEPRFDDGSPFDTYRFQARLGQRLRLTVASDDFDAYAVLAFTDQGERTLLAQDNDAGGNGDALLAFDVPHDGTYELMVTTYEPSGRGAYRAMLEVADPAAEAVPEPAGGWASLYKDPSADPSERYAVLVGIDDYPGERSDLPSCVADVNLMRNVLIQRFGFRPANIVTILDAHATRDHIAAAVLTHLGKAGPDGVAMFYYSGHGTQLESNVAMPDQEDDDKDEALFVWGLDRAASVVVDDELGWLVSQLRTPRVLVALDSCHSGTATREADWLARGKLAPSRAVAEHLKLPERYLGAEDAEFHAKAAAGAFNDLMGASKSGPDNHVLLAASRADQVAQARAGGWPTHGGVASWFTYFLVRELEEGRLDRTWSQVIDRVHQRIRAFARQAGNDPSKAQVPQAEGDAARQDLRRALKMQ